MANIKRILEEVTECEDCGDPLTELTRSKDNPVVCNFCAVDRGE